MSTTISTLTIRPHWNGAHLTPEDFDACDDWEPGHRYELINGVLIVTPPPSEGERGPNEDLGRWLLNHFDSQDSPPYYYTLPEHTVVRDANRRRADRVIWAGLDRFPNVKKRVKQFILFKRFFSLACSNCVSLRKHARAPSLQT